MTKKYHLKSPVERFWKFVNKTDSCWLWTGSTAPSGGNGYGHFWDGRKFVQSPHFAYELLKGKIPKNKQLDHFCRNRKCVNPEHLRIVSIEQNVMENTLGFGPINKAKTHKTRIG